MAQLDASEDCIRRMDKARMQPVADMRLEALKARLDLASLRELMDQIVPTSRPSGGVLTCLHGAELAAQPSDPCGYPSGIRARRCWPTGAGHRPQGPAGMPTPARNCASPTSMGTGLPNGQPRMPGTGSSLTWSCGAAGPGAARCATTSTSSGSVGLQGHPLKRSPDSGDRLAGSTDAAPVLPRAPAWIEFPE